MHVQPTPPAEYAPQGRLWGMPYDWRRPSLAKIKSRLYQPGGPLFPPKVFGWGWTLNFAHPGSWVVLGATALFLVAALALS